MNLIFGVVEKYISDRGFGFVTNELPGGNGESYFFHIKNIKKSCPDLVAGLEGENGTWFWYTLEESQKGKQAIPLNQSQWNARKQEAERMVEQIEKIWTHAGALPSWLDQVTSEVLGADRATQLNQERELLQAEREKIAEEQRKLREAEILELMAKREAERAKRLAEEEAERARQAAVNAAVEAEFEALVADVAAHGFSASSQVSNYIVRNRLGYKYQIISGYLTMELDGRQWEFKGGFPPKIYARLCEALGLGNNGSRAKVIGMESFASHKARTGNF